MALLDDQFWTNQDRFEVDVCENSKKYEMVWSNSQDSQYIQKW